MVTMPYVTSLRAKKKRTFSTHLEMIILRIHQRKVFSQHEIFNDQLSRVLHLLTVTIPHTHIVQTWVQTSEEFSHPCTTLTRCSQTLETAMETTMASWWLCWSRQFSQNSHCSALLDERITKIWLWSWNVLTTRSKIHENISGEKRNINTPSV